MTLFACRVCKAWSKLLAQPSCPVWATVYVSVRAEVAPDRSLSKKSLDWPPREGGVGLMGSSPQYPSSLGSYSYNASFGMSPPSENGSPRIGKMSLGVSVLRAERVLEWLMVRGKACQSLLVDFRCGGR